MTNVTKFILKGQREPQDQPTYIDAKPVKPEGPPKTAAYWGAVVSGGVVGIIAATYLLFFVMVMGVAIGAWELSQKQELYIALIADLMIGPALLGGFLLAVSWDDYKDDLRTWKIMRKYRQR